MGKIVLIFLFSCGGGPIAFEADCGLLVEEGEFNASPEDIIACQHAAVKHQLTTCDLMRGAHLQFMEQLAWVDSYGRTVSGLTFFPGHKSTFDTFSTIQVGNGKLNRAYDGSLIHELRHLQEWAKTNVSQHEGWDTEGIYTEIELARKDAKAEFEERP